MLPEFCRTLAPLCAVKNDVRRPLQRMRLRELRMLLAIALFAVMASAGAMAEDNTYTRIVVFGDSLSDTGNVAHLTESKYGVRIPGPIVNYTDGRATDGYDTQPAALKYFGVWVEQLAASLPSHPQITDSLDGGTNYAYSFATTGNGTRTLAFGPTNAFPVQVKNIGQQITDYLSTHPKISRHTLYIIWGGSEDILSATSPQEVINAAFQQVLNIQRLMDAGATQFLVANVPPLGLTPLLNGSPAAAATANAGSLLFNSYLATGISVLKDFYWFKRPRVYQLNTFRLLSRIVAAPSVYSLSNVTTAAQGQLQVNPDTFLFWDTLHPTTRGHNILAGSATRLLEH